MCDPQFRIEDCGSTPGWEPVVIVSGPIVKQLDFNYGQGMMRVGRQANTSIGRFVRMYLRNICGFRIPPGAGDKGSIGQSFLVAMAEDEDSAREIGWPTYGEDRGFAAGENVVTVHSVVAITSPMYSGGDRARRSRAAVGGGHRRQLHLLGAYGFQDRAVEPADRRRPQHRQGHRARMEQGRRAALPVRQHQGHAPSAPPTTRA